MMDQTVPQIECPSRRLAGPLPKVRVVLLPRLFDSGFPAAASPSAFSTRCTACGELVWDEGEERVQRA